MKQGMKLFQVHGSPASRCSNEFHISSAGSSETQCSTIRRQLRRTEKGYCLLPTQYHAFQWPSMDKGKSLPARQPISAYLENRATTQSLRLKNRLLAEGVFKHQCMGCRRTKWNNQPIPLELDHIDGTTQTTGSKICARCVPTATH